MSDNTNQPIRKLPAVRGLAWVSGSWGLVKRQPVRLLLISLFFQFFLSFSQTGAGLHVNDLFELGGFTASDSPNEPEWGTHFYPVEAKLRSKTEVELTIPEKKNPIRVRYGWQSNPVDANLTNQERLPASPFEIALPVGSESK